MTGKTWFTARTPVPDLGWVAGAGREYDTVMGPLWHDLYLGVGLSVLCLLMSGGIALHYGRMILTDLRGLRDSVTASGNSQGTNGQSKPQSIAEVRSIADAFEAENDRRMEVEQALRESEIRFRSVVENMSEGLMLFDPKGNLIYQNPASLRIHGFEEDQDGELSRDQVPVMWQAWDESGRPVAFEQWPISRVFRGSK
jgi:PAS domain-containing protein